MTVYKLPNGKVVTVMSWEAYQWKKKQQFFKESGSTDLMSLLKLRNGKH